MTLKKKTTKLDKLIGKNVQKLRKKYNINRAQLANSMNVDYKTLWNCENGFNTLSINLLLKMQPLFKTKNITLEMLFNYIVISAVQEYENQ